MNEIAATHGVLVVAAAGNSTQNIDTTLTYPASFDSESMLVVAATTSTQGLAYFSNRGVKNVDVGAPGLDIYSTLPGNTYGSLSGTSMAAPNTAGVAAMIRGYFPKLSPLEVKQVIMDTVTAVKALDKRTVTGGRVDLKAALQNASTL
jgi:thermitase